MRMGTDTADADPAVFGFGLAAEVGRGRAGATMVPAGRLRSSPDLRRRLVAEVDDGAETVEAGAQSEEGDDEAAAQVTAAGPEAAAAEATAGGRLPNERRANGRFRDAADEAEAAEDGAEAGRARGAADDSGEFSAAAAAAASGCCCLASCARASAASRRLAASLAASSCGLNSEYRRGLSCWMIFAGAFSSSSTMPAPPPAAA